MQKFEKLIKAISEIKVSIDKNHIIKFENIISN